MRLGTDRGGLLVMVADIAETRVAANRVEEMHDSPAGDQIDVGDSAFGQEVHDVVGELDHDRFLRIARSAKDTGAILPAPTRGAVLSPSRSPPTGRGRA